MSKRYTDYVNYECDYDCTERGCPGHKMRIVYNGSSDTLYIEVDGNDYSWFNLGSFGALKELMQSKGVIWL